MERDGVLLPLAPGVGHARDIPVTATARALAVGLFVPHHTVVSGLAGLWIHGGCGNLGTLDLVGKRGLHRAAPGYAPRGWILRFHSGNAAREPASSWADVRVASPERCAADALRWHDLGGAIPAVLEAVRRGVVVPDDLNTLVKAEDPRGSGAARVRSAWGALRIPAEKAYDGRLAPVTRRTS